MGVTEKTRMSMFDQIFSDAVAMTVDAKGRVGIPSKYMAVLQNICPERVDSVGVMVTPDRSIKVMPMPFAESEFQRIMQLSDQVAAERLIKAISTQTFSILGFDKQNRIKLSAKLMEKCGLQKNVMVVGSGSYMEIYDAAAWDKKFDLALDALGDALDEVATREMPQAPVQYVVNAAPAPSPPKGSR